jgi:hypothetical protein
MVPAILGIILGLNWPRMAKKDNYEKTEQDPTLNLVSSTLCIFKDQITIRPIMPDDVGKISWTWAENDWIQVPSNKFILLKGISGQVFRSIKLSTMPWPHGNIIGLLTSWDNTANILLYPGQKIYIRSGMANEKLSPEVFAFRGVIYEPRGTTII